jgi:NAD(P)-dependent dehydrogenase (short-subunit alcohol dehydrogenase family)
MPSVLITGASRGLGFEFARQYAEEGWRVFATCRKPKAASKLAALLGTGQVTIHRLDVTCARDLDALDDELGQSTIDLLINNAGIYGSNSQMTFGTTDYAHWEEIARITVIAPFRIAEKLVERIAASEGKTIASITSRLGSIGDNEGGGIYAYRASAAGLNMVTKSLAIDLKERGIKVVALDAGWVRTDMGGPKARLSPQECVERLRGVIANLDPGASGKQIDYRGHEVPW